MGTTSFILGIFALGGVCVALIPLLNVLNCLALPLALFGTVFGLVDVLRADRPGQSKTLGIAGLVMNLLALGVGLTRFVISLLASGGII